MRSTRGDDVEGLVDSGWMLPKMAADLGGEHRTLWRTHIPDLILLLKITNIASMMNWCSERAFDVQERG